MKTLMGYADKISLRAGEALAFKVSSNDSKPYSATIVRLINGDTNPIGPGYKEVEIAGSTQLCQGRPQTVKPGSCLIIPSNPHFEILRSFSLELLMWPTTPQKEGQVLASLWDEGGHTGFILYLDGAAGLVLQLGDGSNRPRLISLSTAVLERRWYRIHATYDGGSGNVTLRQTPLSPAACVSDFGELGANEAGCIAAAARAPLIFAARKSDGVYGGFFNGKIEAPVLRQDGTLVGAWDFSIGIDSETVQDISGNALHGAAHQMPTRAMTGHNWDGSEANWRHAPDQYGAIHFHDDDISDADWETDFTWTAPCDLPSGLYAARLIGPEDEDHIPFVLRPATRADRAKLLFIVPTASYLAYANEHLALDAALAERVHDHVPIFGPNDLYLAEHRELGGSLYDRHSDGSGIFTTSRLRPILNMRPKYQSWLGGGTGSALWQLNADTHLLAWLEHEGVVFDCISDEDLDREGTAALAGYTCIMTGTHDEYWSTRMRDALESYLGGGGNLMHMGGNSLYWRVVFHPSGNGVVEVRRCEVGNGWITAPGEAFHAFNGEYGGLWRRIGRAPQQLAGVGFASEGFDCCSYYRRLPDSFDPRAAFIFEGIEDDIIGDFGLIGGGAAGIELDRTDPMLGTPPSTLILARSEAHTSTYVPAVEELLINYVGQAEISPAYAEMVFFETPSGGGVFATGSIAYAGSLSHQGYNNNVALLSRNVLRRFVDPMPFPTKDAP
jgi:N,N-dimethylformamidase